MILNKKGVAKISLSVLIGLTVILTLYTFNVAALIFPGILPGESYPTAMVNASKGDMFFANGDNVSILVNYTCAPPSVCNESMTVTGNFSEIGGSQNRAGVFSSKGAGWVIYSINSTVNMAGLSNIGISPKTIYLNVTDANSTLFNDQVNATVILVNMSTIPSCPPAGSGVVLPPVMPLNNGTIVPITDCVTSCTGEDRAEYNGTNWNVCGPNFGGSTTNFTQLASTGNFSNFKFVIEIPNKVKLNFTTNVSMDTPEKAQSLFEFAMKNIMSGPKIGINETEWNGVTKPNLTSSALITFYNISSRFGFTGRPQLLRSGYDGSSPASCPPSICSGITFSGNNITFTVSGFSSYTLTDAINVTLASPNATWTGRNVNFVYVPVFDSSVTMSNCTLYGNFSGSWAANATNSTPLVSGAPNTIGSPIPDGIYKWNVECYDNTGLGDTGSGNLTFFVDGSSPRWFSNSTKVASGSQYSPGKSYQFNVTWNDSVTSISTVLIENNFTGALANYTVSTNEGDIYYYNIADISAGTYAWREFANDSLGNWNATDSWVYVISKNTTNPVNLTINNGTAYNNQNVSITYGTPITAICFNSYDCAGSCSLYRNGTFLGNNETITLAAGVYNYTINTTGNTNYSANAGSTYNVTVSKAAQILVISNNTSISGSYPYPISITGSGNNTQAIFQINGTNITSLEYTTLLGVGYYNFTLNVSANANYLANFTSLIVNISKGDPSSNMFVSIDGTVADKSITYGSSTTTLGYDNNAGDSDCDYALFRTDTSANITNPNTQTLSAGTYTYFYNITNTCANWTSGTTGNRILTVTNSGSVSSSSGGSISSSTSSTPYVRIAKGSANITLSSLTTSGKMITTIAKYEDMAIRGMNITVLNNVANIRLVIVKLSAMPSSVSYGITGIVYNYISVDETNISNSDIKSVDMRFAVNKTWLAINGLDASSITLYRWNGNSWADLNATKSSEDSSEVFFNVKSPGLSIFAIGERGTVAPVPTPTPTPTETPTPTPTTTPETVVTPDNTATSGDLSGIITAIVIVIVLGAASTLIFINRKKIMAHPHAAKIAAHIRRSSVDRHNRLEVYSAGKMRVDAEE